MKPIRKTVSFAEYQKTREFSTDYEINFSEVWFSAEEYDQIKARSRSESKEWRRKGYGVLLKESFEYPRSDTQKCLNAFCQLEGELTRRGLERQLSRQHGEERSDLKERSRDSVLIHQMRLKRQGCKTEEIVEQLGLVYREVTRPAKIFARKMAKGDELVAKEGENTGIAMDLLEEREQRQRHQKMERRLSNYSSMSGISTSSVDSMASKRRWRLMGTRRKSGKGSCPSSPASPMEQFYAAGIA